MTNTEIAMIALMTVPVAFLFLIGVITVYAIIRFFGK